jgi:hypothetical protein
MAVEKAFTPKSGLAGAPVGVTTPPLAWAVLTKGFKPPIGSMRPALVKMPIFIKSRREMDPCE